MAHTYRARLPERDLDIVDAVGRLDLDNLVDESQRTGAELVFFGILTAQAKRRASLADLALKIGKAQLGKKWREKLENSGQTATVGAIQDAIRTDPEYRKLNEALFEAEEAANVIESTKFALVQKYKNLDGYSTLVVQEHTARKAGTPPSSHRTAATRR